MAAVEIKGLEALRLSLNKFVFDLDKAIDDAVRLTAFAVQKEAINLIRTPSIGKKYRKSETVIHIASKPGDAPNTDTGRLIGSIEFTHDRGSQVAFVGTNVDYGAILELSMNRPWLEPAKDNEIGGFSDRMSAVLDDQIKKAGR